MIQKLFKFMEAKPELPHRLTGCFGFSTLQNTRLPSSVEPVVLQHGYRGGEEREEETEAEGRGSWGGPLVPGSQPPVCMRKDTVKWL